MTPLEAALKYADKNMSVIPIGKDKKPLIKWEPHQKTRASHDAIRQWWKKHPAANVGIVTGEISNLFVVDCDTPDAIKRIEEAIPESLVVPCEITPRGGKHFFFAHEEGFSNRAKVANGIYIRTTGGYVAVAPSVNGTGKHWQWVNSILAVEVPKLLLSIKDIISNSFSLYRAHTDEKITESQEVSKVSKSQFFWEFGTRDETLFTTANSLIKGNCNPELAENVLNLIVNSWGENDPAWVHAKVKSAIDRAARRERNIAQELRDWINESVGGQFKVSDWYRESAVVSKMDKHAAIVALRKLCDEGLVERIGKRTGEYRIIEKDFTIQQWWEQEGDPLPIKMPLGVHELCKIYPGNIILLEGQKSQGKSAFALEVCRLNKKLFDKKIRYQNVEMSDSELRERFMSYPSDTMPILEWKEYVEFIKRTSDWWDLIEPDGFNVIDYLVEYEKAYLIAQFIFNIHQKLKTGIALIVVQRDPFKPYGVGGRGVRDIPRLILSLINHVIKIEDVKSFPAGKPNPTGMSRMYKQVHWWKFHGVTDWASEKTEKPERKSWVE